MEDAEEHLRLANRTAHRFCGGLSLCAADRDDARQEAYLGLVIACREHDPKRPGAAPFLGYAVCVMRRRLQDWLHRRPVAHRWIRDYSPAPRRVPLTSPRAGRRLVRDADPSEGVILDEVRGAVEQLPAEQREAVQSYFGLDDAPGMTALARERGMTRQAMYCRKDEGLKELRSALS